jgi:hypothetical protein
MTDPELLQQRIDALEHLCGEAYQFAGAVGAPVRVLDALAAAANGDPLPAGSLLPVGAEECDAIADLRLRLERVRAAVAV